MSAEFLCNRWTLLILRELLFGSSGFNDIARGVPRMSRSLLSSRLKELVKIGLVTRRENRRSGQTDYTLTEAGRALEPVVVSIANWGQEWLEIEPSVKEVDVGLLMWDIRRNIKPIDDLPNPFIVHFCLLGVPDNKTNHWLVYENGEVDLCYIDEGFRVDVDVEVDAKTLVKVWMGWESLDGAIADGDFVMEGPKAYTRLVHKWLGKSSVADTRKQAKEMRAHY